MEKLVEEKIILIFYINVGNVDDIDVSTYINEIADNFKPNKGDEMIHYYIPIRDGETRVECINPKLVSDEDYQMAKESLDENLRLINEIRKENERI